MVRDWGGVCRNDELLSSLSWTTKLLSSLSWTTKLPSSLSRTNKLLSSLSWTNKLLPSLSRTRRKSRAWSQVRDLWAHIAAWYNRLTNQLPLNGLASNRKDKPERIHQSGSHCSCQKCIGGWTIRRGNSKARNAGPPPWSHVPACLWNRRTRAVEC